MIYLIIGKSATGKDTVLQRLCKASNLNLNRMIQYTTRPIKTEEENGREYYFVDEKKMYELKASGHILECRKYDTVYGKWYYFTTDEEIEEGKDYILIGTLPVLKDLRKTYGKVKGIYLYLDDGERLQRALNRERNSKEPRYSEMCRRFLSDDKDFSKEALEDAKIDLYIENKELETTINKLCTFIKESDCLEQN